MNTWKLLFELAQLKRNERRSPAQLKKLQQKKLRRLLVYAFHHSSYHHRAFVRAGIDEGNVRTAPLSAFPVMDKQILLQHFDEIITVPDLTQEELRRFDAETVADRSAYKGKYHVAHSSGSTGRDSFVMLAEKTSGGVETVIQAEIIAQIRMILEKKGLGYVRFNLEFVREILPDPVTGKKRLIVQNNAERWAKAG